MKKSFLLLILISIIITACSNYGEWKDDEINRNVKTQVHIVHDLVIESLKTNALDQILMLGSERFVRVSGLEFEELVSQARGDFQKYDFSILHEYYVKSKEKDVPLTIPFEESGYNDFIIGFKTTTKESYVVLGYLENDIKEALLAIVYGNYDGQWKINTAQFGIYRIMKKDSYEWYQQAKEEVAKENYINASMNMALSLETLKPGRSLWKYVKEEEIYAYAQYLDTLIHEEIELPLTVTYVPTHPQIFKISAYGFKEGYFPLIEYVSSISLSDTTRLSKECDLLHKQISHLFKGIEENHEVIVYNAYNHMPSAMSMYDSHGFIKQVE